MKPRFFIRRYSTKRFQEVLMDLDPARCEGIEEAIAQIRAKWHCAAIAVIWTQPDADVKELEYETIDE